MISKRLAAIIIVVAVVGGAGGLAMTMYHSMKSPKIVVTMVDPVDGSTMFEVNLVTLKFSEPVIKRKGDRAIFNKKVEVKTEADGEKIAGHTETVDDVSNDKVNWVPEVGKFPDGEYKVEVSGKGIKKAEFSFTVKAEVEEPEPKITVVSITPEDGAVVKEIEEKFFTVKVEFSGEIDPDKVFLVLTGPDGNVIAQFGRSYAHSIKVKAIAWDYEVPFADGTYFITVSGEGGEGIETFPSTFEVKTKISETEVDKAVKEALEAIAEAVKEVAKEGEK